jgi:hypothetical protein
MHDVFFLAKLIQLLTTALATLLLVFGLSFVGGGLAIWQGAAPSFNWKLAIDEQRMLVVHNGLNGPACPTAPRSVDCAWRIPGHREFDAHYVTPHEDRVLIAFELPKR